MQKYVHIGPVRIDADLRRDVDVCCDIRGLTQQAYVSEALAALVARDRAENEVAYQALSELRRRLDEEVNRQRKSA